MSEGPESAGNGARPREEAANLPVLAAVPDARPIERFPAPVLPAPVAAATGGFLAGVATFVLVRVMRRRNRPRVIGRRRRRDGGLEIAGSRSFLVDVHLLRR